VAAAHIEKAHEKLRVARLLLREDAAADSISRSYYPVFRAAHAALAQVGESPRSHRGTHDRFWMRFVKTGRFPRTVFQIHSNAQDMREQADYEAFTRFDTAAASDLLEDAEGFVDEVETLLNELQDSPSDR